MPSVGTGVIVRGELAIVIRRKRTSARYPQNLWVGGWTGADVDLENDRHKSEKIELRELKRLGQDV